MHDLFYGIEGDEDSMSYLDMCLKWDRDFEGLFEVEYCEFEEST